VPSQLIYFKVFSPFTCRNFWQYSKTNISSHHQHDLINESLSFANWRNTTRDRTLIQWRSFYLMDLIVGSWTNIKEPNKNSY